MPIKSLLIWGVIAIVLVVLFGVMTGGQTPRNASEITYSQLLGHITARDLTEAETSDNTIVSHSNRQQTFVTYLPTGTMASVVDRLTAANVNVKTDRPKMGPSIGDILLGILPMLLLIGAWFFFMRQMQAGGRGAMGFGRSKARLLTETKGRITFDDVAGIDEAKDELAEIVEFLKDPGKFQRLGGKIPKGALLVGPPGTGKTLLARAIAGEANVPFFTISGSDFVEMFVGVGASRVRDMFEQAKKNAPCIIFIDEIDAVGRHRGAGLGGGNDEREQTLNQLLVEMDGFEANEGIILIAATNRPDVLDPALLRPGRFDRQVVVPNPDIVGREKILRVHTRNVPVAQGVDLKVIARGTPGFSGADLANLVNEAALLAARRGKRVVTSKEFEDAKDRVMMGAERRSMAMTEEEKRATAVHESGHALVNIFVKGNDPLHKVTIIPRGRALGVTWSLPEADKLSYSKEWCQAKIAMSFGGRVAEQLVYGDEHLNTGASNDIMQATDIARRMVTEWGMSEVLGPLRYAANEQEVFLGHSVTQRQNMSGETAKLVDQEVRRIVTEGEQRARQVLNEHLDDLKKLSEALVEYETLSGDEVTIVLRGEKLNRPEDQPKTPSPPTPALPITDEEPAAHPGAWPGAAPQGA
ncbi:MAG: ATP-dependent metallopeptidase FtsH/Yme1/Tma family protein [Proteobacteria bacterium]|nr:ATP-dependent metallopeptidase FtsH/Yme1/Tma family protein [Pseudomonadota bacterium]